jgi:hypothetical protein
VDEFFKKRRYIIFGSGDCSKVVAPELVKQRLKMKIILLHLAAFATIAYIAALFFKNRKKKKKNSLVFIFNLQSTIQIKSSSMTLTLTDTQMVSGTIGQPVDAKGYSAAVQTGSVVFTSSDETVATVAQDPTNEYGFTVTAQKPGVAQITATADADLGEGVSNITGFFGVEVTGGAAIGFGNPTFGNITEQPAATAPSGTTTGTDTNTTGDQPQA